VWALGFPLSVGHADSPVFHPVVPLLLERILLDPTTPAADAGQAMVGQAVDLAAWFDRTHVDGTLRRPDGSEIAVKAGPRAPARYVPEAAGAYRLQQNARTTVRVVNYPREPDPRLFARAEWERSRPQTRTTWYDDDVPLPRSAFTALAGRAPDTRRRLDLSPVLLALLVCALLLEQVMLCIAWRREAAVAV
jgi:hypothetical protein